MAIIDAQLIFSENVAVAASLNSGVIDLGKNGATIHPLLIDVKLATPNTTGKVTSVKVQSSADEAFTTAVDEAAFYVPDSLDQTRACTLAQFYSPIKPGNRYVRLVYTGAAGIAGGKLFAYMTNGTQVPA